jgi:glucose-1-phosphate adenylyltransferase
VEPGAVVRESVLLPGAVVRAGAVVERAVLDEGVEVAPGARVGEPGGEIALVGLRARVEESAPVPGGGRFPPVDDDG